MGDSELIPAEKRIGKVDRISQLPDELIIEILSLLSLKQSVGTGVLSRRWLDLWKDMKILKLERFSFRGMVKSVCQSDRSLSLKEFTISLVLNTRSKDEDSDLGLATKWIKFAFLRPVERLELDFNFLLTPSYGCSVVLEDILVKCNISLISRCCVLKSSLKELRLANLRVSGETVQLFLRNCPLLEVLIIHETDLTSDVKVFGGGGGGALKHLDILKCNYSRRGKAIKVSAPNLITYLRIDADSIWPLQLLHNFPKLVEGDFVFNSYRDDVAHHFSRVVFSRISQLQSLTISLNYRHKYLARGFPEMPQLKKLVVKYYGVNDDDDDLQPLLCLIWAAPCLEEFKLEVKISNGGFRMQKPPPMKFPMIERLNIGHRHVKVFEFVKFEGNRCKDHMEVVKYISDNCHALEKIIIRPITDIPSRWLCRVDPRAAWEFVKQELPTKLPSHIQLLIH